LNRAISTSSHRNNLIMIGKVRAVPDRFLFSEFDNVYTRHIHR